MYEYAIRELKIIKDYIMDLYNDNKMSKSTRLKVKDFEEAIKVLELLQKNDFDYPIDILNSHKGEMYDEPLLEADIDNAIKILEKRREKWNL